MTLEKKARWLAKGGMKAKLIHYGVLIQVDSSVLVLKSNNVLSRFTSCCSYVPFRKMAGECSDRLQTSRDFNRVRPLSANPLLNRATEQNRRERLVANITTGEKT